MDMFGWSRKKACIINMILILVLSMPCVLGYNVWSEFRPIMGKDVLDSEDFIVSNLLLPGGALIFVLFCSTKFGWGFDKYLAETNTGDGMKMPRWLKPYLTYVLPILILSIFVFGILNFQFADNFTILGWIKSFF